MNERSSRWTNSLMFSIGAIIIAVEIFVFAVTGVFYTRRFSDEIDRRLSAQIQLPGTLMRHGLLNYESVVERETMTELVGENFTDGFVASTNGLIFYSLNEDYFGRNVADIPDFEFKEYFNQNLEETVVLTSTDGESLVSISPLKRDDVLHLGFLYIRTGTNHADRERDSVIQLFVISSAICIVLTSFFILLSFDLLTSRRINNLLEVMKSVEAGDLKVRASEARGLDEIGILEHGVNSMIGQLEELFATLEQRVNARTRDLQIAANVARQITTELDINKVMHQVVAQTNSGFNFSASLVYLFDEQANRLICASGATADAPCIDAATLPDIPLDAEANPVGRAARTRQTVIVQDVANENSYQPQFLSTRSELAIPMMLGPRLLGVFNVHSELPHNFGKEELRSVPILSEQTAIAVRNAQLFSEAQHARETAEEANRIKSQFLANMSHELRTPLNAILNCTGFVYDELYGPLNEKQRNNLSRVLSSGEYLLSLINDILDITKIETGVVSLFVQQVNLNVILSDITTTLESLVSDRPVKLVVDIAPNLPLIWGDNRQLRQVFLNLSSNALKFTPSGTITIAAHQHADDILISITDTGIGIDPADQEQIFEAFYQAKHDLPGISGTGLGLPISKHFVEAHGGRLWLTSTPGSGSAFYVSIPIDNKDLLASDQPPVT